MEKISLASCRGADDEFMLAEAKTNDTRQKKQRLLGTLRFQARRALREGLKTNRLGQLAEPASQRASPTLRRTNNAYQAPDRVAGDQLGTCPRSRRDASHPLSFRLYQLESRDMFSVIVSTRSLYEAKSL